MLTEGEVSSSTLLKIDLGDWDIFEVLLVLELDAALSEKMIVRAPLINFGSTQSHMDICADLITAAYVAEQLGKYAASVKADFEEVNYKASYKLTLQKPTHGIWSALKQCAAIFLGDEAQAENIFGLNLVDIYSDIEDFEENIDSVHPFTPTIIDHYYMNLIYGVYGMYDYEQLANDGLKRFPERQIGYCRSAASFALGMDCFVSASRWAIPSAIDLNKFFEVADERFRLHEFEVSNQHVIGDQIYEFGPTVAVCFNFGDYEDCRNASSHLLKRKKSGLRDRAFLSRNPISRQRCLLHETGRAALIDDGQFTHIFFETKKLGASDTVALANSTGELAAAAAQLIGLGRSITLPWKDLNDDEFELVCYDVLCSDSRFDETTIKKMGKSRSRDGGRDIVVNEKSRNGQMGRKWLFQCKLIRNGKSLSSSMVQNIGDMLEQYQAGGFGLMTSTVIDATLYDRTEALCVKRNIIEGHFSVYELERVLARNQGIRARHFSK